MKIRSYMIAVAIILLTFSSATNKAIADLGQVEIDDLFYNSGTPSTNGEIKKFEFDQVDKILMKNEDLELESLEIADIDLATFGEYESFLNKYYDDNFMDISSKAIKQIEFISGGIIGQKIPFGTNAKNILSNGISIGANLNNMLNFKYKTFDFATNLEINYGSSKFKTAYDRGDGILTGSKYNILNIEPSLIMTLNKNIFLKSGLGLMSIKRINLSDGETIEKTYGFSSFLELQYRINVYNDIHLTLFSKAKLEKPIGDLVLYNSSSTVNSLIFGIGTI
ncbi:hypothetical protein N9263_00210, partial [Candidatus Marinimicrobia bacterium]|nr:hypothetical protein [Candidatus Neomarinimicrobiota bacterium]